MSREMVRSRPRRTARATMPGEGRPGFFPRSAAVDSAAACVGRGVGALLLLLLAASSTFGQAWAEKMFDHTSYDFGTVARGTKMEHTFTVENRYEEDITIVDVYSSCGCTVPRVDKHTLKTWEKADIVAAIDTRSFYGQKDATLTVVFGGDFPAEVQLTVHSYIRTDVVVEPDSVQFGSVAEGADAVQKVKVSYAGRPDWQILDVKSPNPNIEARAVKVPASPVGDVTYEVQVRLKAGAPAGYLREYLTLVTNDRQEQTAKVPLAVEGVVVAAVTARPSPLLLGVVAAGKTATGQLVVQGKAPFRITGVESSDPRLSCPVPDAEKSLHLLPVTFAAGETGGELKATLRIQTTAAPGKPLEVPVTARVLSATPATTPSPTPSPAG